jgi:hypothetical protein
VSVANSALPPPARRLLMIAIMTFTRAATRATMTPTMATRVGAFSEKTSPLPAPDSVVRVESGSCCVEHVPGRQTQGKNNPERRTMLTGGHEIAAAIEEKRPTPQTRLRGGMGLRRSEDDRLSTRAPTLPAPRIWLGQPSSPPALLPRSRTARTGRRPLARSPGRARSSKRLAFSLPCGSVAALGCYLPHLHSALKFTLLFPLELSGVHHACFLGCPCCGPVRISRCFSAMD